MANVKRVLRCHNCGTILQSEDRNKPGFISKNVFDGDSAPKIPYCNHCYEKMLLFNASDLEEKVDNAIIKILDDAVATDAFIVWVVDLFTFDGFINKDIARKIRNNRLTVIGTKRDLFPAKLKDDTFIRFITESFEAVGLKPQSINIVGDTSSADGELILSSLNNCRKGHDVYMLGDEDCGKTTIINKMLKQYENKSKWTIRSETYPGTSVKVLEIPLSNSSFFYKLPDLSISNSVLSKVEKDVLKQIIPHKEVSVFQKTLSSGEGIAVGNIGFFVLLKGKNTSFKFYAAENVEYKKMPVEKYDTFLKTNIEKKYVRPVSERYSLFSDYDIFEYTMEKDGKVHDITIEGLCTASFVATGQIIRVSLPKGVALRESLAKIR